MTDPDELSGDAWEPAYRQICEREARGERAERPPLLARVVRAMIQQEKERQRGDRTTDV